MCGRTAVRQPSTVIFRQTAASRLVTPPHHATFEPVYNLAPLNYVPVLRYVMPSIEHHAQSDEDVGDGKAESDEDITAVKEELKEADAVHDKSYDNYSTEAPADQAAETDSQSVRSLTEQCQTDKPEGELLLQYMQWGLLPSYTKDAQVNNLNSRYKMINARSETVDQRPTFRRLVKRHRCIAVTSGFYEWQNAPQPMGKPDKKLPFFVHMPYPDGKLATDHLTADGHPEDPPLMYLAALYDRWVQHKPSDNTTDVNTDANRVKERYKALKEQYTVTILTTSPSKELDWLHDRMPVILKTSKERDMWLKCHEHSFEECLEARLLVGKTGLNWYQCNDRIGNTKNKEKDVILPAEEIERRKKANGIGKFFSSPNKTPTKVVGRAKREPSDAADSPSSKSIKHERSEDASTATPTKSAATTPTHQQHSNNNSKSHPIATADKLTQPVGQTSLNGFIKHE